MEEMKMTNAIDVLIVEDEPADAELLLLELNRGGFKPNWERVDTEAAFRRALVKVDWDVIISDFAMPRFNGLRAFEIFSEYKLDIPFIFVSGALGEERAVEAMRAGAQDYFVKGQLKRLNAAIRRELAAVEDRKSRRLAEMRARKRQHRLAVALRATGALMFEEGNGGQRNYYDAERWAEMTGHDCLPSFREDSPFPLLDWLSEAVHKDDRREYNIHYARYRRGNSDTLQVPFRLPHSSGHWLHLSLYVAASEWTNRAKPNRSVGLLLDRTQNAELERQLRQSQKLEEVGRLAGGIAHDFNNLLTVMVSFASFASERLSPDHPACEDIKEVLAAADRAQNLTSQLLAFSASRIVESQSFSLNDVVSEMSNMLRRVFPDNVAIHTELAPDLWNIYADPGGISQILMNLTVNARDAMAGQGTVTIRTSNVSLEGTANTRMDGEAVAGEYVVLSVSDTGSGMDEETKNRIFEPFFTTKDTGKGTGLGLSTCYGIAKQARGWISLQTAVGEGTTFEVWFPKSELVSDSPLSDSKPESTQGSEAVLVAEDDPKIALVAERTLERNGYRVFCAADGKEALRLAQQQSIDLLVSDLMMPGMNGHELAARVQDLQPEISVLFISGYDADIGTAAGSDNHPQHVLQKPFSGQELALKVREVLDITRRSDADVD